MFSKISPDSTLFLHQALAGPRGQLLPAAGSDDSSASVLGVPLPAGSVVTAPGAGSEGEEEEGGEQQEVVQQVAGKSAGALLWSVGGSSAAGAALLVFMRLALLTCSG